MKMILKTTGGTESKSFKRNHYEFRNHNRNGSWAYVLCWGNLFSGWIVSHSDFEVEAMKHLGEGEFKRTAVKIKIRPRSRK